MADLKMNMHSGREVVKRYVLGLDENGGNPAPASGFGFLLCCTTSISMIVRRLMREDGCGADASASVTLAPSAPSALLDVERAIGNLPEPQRRPLLPIGLEGLRCDEAAEILGVPIGTVRSRIGPTRNTLRKLLERNIESTSKQFALL